MDEKQAQVAMAPPKEVIALMAGTILALAGAIALRGNAAIAPWQFSWLLLLSLFGIYCIWKYQDAYKDKRVPRGLLFFATFLAGMATMQLGMRLFGFVSYFPVERVTGAPYLVAGLITLSFLVFVLVRPEGVIARMLNSTAGTMAFYFSLLAVVLFTAWLVDRIDTPLPPS